MLISCRKQAASEKAPEMTAGEEKEMLLRVNKFLVQKDVELIESYSKRQRLEHGDYRNRLVL